MASGCWIAWFWPIGPAEHDALLGVARGARERGPADADGLGGDQDALRVHAVQDVLEALALLADAILQRHRQAVEEQLVGVDRLAAHLVDHARLDVVCGRARCRTGDRPSVRFFTSSSGVVRASSSTRSATCAVEIQIFCPCTA